MELRSSDNPYSNNLEQAFYSNKQENAALEQLRFTGIYDIVLKELFGSNHKYHTGIRGNRNEEFDIYFHRIDSSIPEKIRRYKGQVELDYTIWTKDSVLLFEAKQIDDTNVTRYLDIGWHKFAFAAIRFILNENVNVYPVYFLKSTSQIFLFIFPQICFHKEDIVFNDKAQMTPARVFVINT